MRLASFGLTVVLALASAGIRAQTITADTVGAHNHPERTKNATAPFTYPTDSWFGSVHMEHKSLRTERFHYNASNEKPVPECRAPSAPKYRHR